MVSCEIVSHCSHHVQLGRLKPHIQYADPFSVWLDSKQLHMPDPNSTDNAFLHEAYSRLAAFATRNMQSKLPAHMREESDASFLTDHTLTLMSQSAPIIKRASLAYEGAVANPQWLMRRDVAAVLLSLGSSEDLAPYVAVTLASPHACRQKDRYWCSVCHVAWNAIPGCSRAGKEDGGQIVGLRWAPGQNETGAVARHACPSSSAAERFQSAKAWYATVYQDVHSATPALEPFSTLEMCPLLSSNMLMCASANRIAYVRRLLEEAHDLTLVFRCGQAMRAKMWELGGRTYEDALRLHEEGRLRLPRCAPEIIAANMSERRMPVLASEAESGICGSIGAESHTLIASRIVKPACGCWVATDFETIQDHGGKLWIFMIASLARREPDADASGKAAEPASEVQVMATLCAEEQARVLREWFEWLKSYGAPAVVHWSPAERIFLKKVVDTHSARLGAELSRGLLGIQWLDMCAVFVTNRLAIRGCFDYKLKHVAKALHALGKLSRTWEDGGVSNGLEAMHKAKEHYDSSLTRKRSRDGLSLVQRYNETDTRVLYDITLLVAGLLHNTPSQPN